MNSIDKEITEALTESPEDIEMEEILPEADSPLNQPVQEKVQANGQNFSQHHDPQNEYGPPPGTPLDAPEQQIENQNAQAGSPKPQSETEPQTIPLSQAKMAAEGLLGMTNNVLEVGGGFFVKIKKHKEFYEFDEVIQVIEQQNDKNVKRIKLDEEDKALLTPLMAVVIQKRAKALSPEQQLIAASLSILIKKAGIVMEIRAENQILTERILDIIKEENASNKQESESINHEEEIAPETDSIADPIDHEAPDSPPTRETEDFIEDIPQNELEENHGG